MRITFGSPEANRIVELDRHLQMSDNELNFYRVKGTTLVRSPDGDETQDAHIDIDEVVSALDADEALIGALLEIGIRRHEEWNGQISRL